MSKIEKPVKMIDERDNSNFMSGQVNGWNECKIQSDLYREQEMKKKDDEIAQLVENIEARIEEYETQQQKLEKDLSEKDLSVENIESAIEEYNRRCFLESRRKW